MSPGLVQPRFCKWSLEANLREWLCLVYSYSWPWHWRLKTKGRNPFRACYGRRPPRREVEIPTLWGTFKPSNFGAVLALQSVDNSRAAI